MISQNVSSLCSASQENNEEIHCAEEKHSPFSEFSLHFWNVFARNNPRLMGFMDFSMRNFLFWVFSFLKSPYEKTSNSQNIVNP